MGFQLREEKWKGLNILEDKTISELAKKYGKSNAQIVLNWHLNRGIIVIPKTMNKTRLPENLACYDFKMSAEDYAAMEKIDKGARFFNPLYIKDYGWDNLPYYE